MASTHDPCQQAGGNAFPATTTRQRVQSCLHDNRQNTLYSRVKEVSKLPPAVRGKQTTHVVGATMPCKGQPLHTPPANWPISPRGCRRG
jgi:hypothetical protein